MAYPVPGLVVVAGGKHTTYRVMAKDAVDAAVHALDRRGRLRWYGRGAGAGARRPQPGRAAVRRRLPQAEIVYACSREGARHLEGVLTRRTRISIETFDRGTRGARQGAELVAGVLGWDSGQVEREVKHCEKRVEAERGSQWRSDDQTADAARLGASATMPL